MKKEWQRILIFAGMMILAILICIPLWQLTHKNKNAEFNAANTEEAGGSETDPSEANAEEAGGNETEPSAANAEEDGTNETDANAADTEENRESSTDTLTESEASDEDESGAVEGSIQDPVSGDKSMSFQEVSEEVTAKDVTNLRSVPSTEDAENVVTQLKNGEKLTRTGINTATGWSRLTLNGETVYAVTQFLTTDMSYKPPVAAANPNRVSTLDGRVIIFVDSDDYITPKEYVNLRTEPSTSEGDSTVKCQVHHGESVHRTGYSADSGWSRVEYNGEVLYVVSSLMQGVTE